MARRIVVSGGAGFHSGPDGLALDEFVLALTRIERPRVCYLATAAGDHPEFVQTWYDQFRERADTTHLPVFLPPFRDPEQTLLYQDVIMVSGGSTSNQLAVWRLHGIDELLVRALDRGTILCGSSAGGICWFESGLSDSLTFDGSLRPLTNGLGLLRGSHAPHGDDPDRRIAFESMVAGGHLPDGIAIDEFAAVHFVDGVIHEVVTSRRPATAHLVERLPDGSSTTTALTARHLGT